MPQGLETGTEAQTLGDGVGDCGSGAELGGLQKQRFRMGGYTRKEGSRCHNCCMALFPYRRIRGQCSGDEGPSVSHEAADGTKKCPSFILFSCRI
jgi:hypothetical protein